MKITSTPLTTYTKDGDNYVVEVALAGWEEDDISVIVENLELTIKGEKQDSDAPPKHMAYKGISTKNFSKKFVLALTTWSQMPRSRTDY